MLAALIAALLVQAPSSLPVEDQVANGQKAAWSAAQIDKMKDQLKRLLKVLEDARSKKDIVKLNYVNEKLAQAKGLLRVAEQADVQLQEALARQDQETVRHEFRKIDMAAQRSRQLQRDAEASIGESAVYSGATKVIVHVSGDSFDPTVMSIGDLITQPILIRPFQVSPYQ